MASRRYRTSRSGEVGVEVRWRDAAGRSRSRSFPEKPRRDWQVFLADLERRQRLGPLYEAPSELFGEFYRGWVERVKQPLAESTHEKAVEAGVNLGVPRDPEGRLQGLAGYFLEQLTAGLVEDEIALVARRAPRQAQLALAHLKQCLRNAGRRGQLFDERILEIPPPAYTERQPVFLTWERSQDLASWCAEPNLILFGVLAGLRQGECFALDERAVNVDAGSVLVEAGSRRGQRTRTKSRRARTVWLCDQARQIVREQLVRRPAGTTLVFPSPAGRHWRKDNFMARVFRPAAVHAGLGTLDRDDQGRGHYQGIVFHDLRHTCASLMIAAGANPLEVAEQLGHFDKTGRPDPRLIWQRYGHLYEGATRRAVQRLDQLIQPSDQEAAADA